MISSKQEYKIGDCRDLMQEMEPDSVDLIVTDPPYGYSFMGKDWDKAVPSVGIWEETLRILKPGAFAFIMSAPRQDVLAHNLVNLSDAGFETGFTSIYWTFASGFPKAGNIGKMVDKRLGETSYGYKHELKNNKDKALDGSYSGFQPKPAVEIIMVVMKPLSKSTYVDQAMKNQHGITWLDDGRIPYQSDKDKGDVNRFKGVTMLPPEEGFNQNNVVINSEIGQNGGRFPANLLVSDDVLNNGKITGGSSNRPIHSNKSKYIGETYGKYDDNIAHRYNDSGSFSRYFDLDAWFDKKNLPEEVQKTFPFIIIPKASKSEKNKGFTGNKKQGGSMSENQGKTMDLGEAALKQKPKQIQPVINNHPTVKPVKLFSWLMTIGSREGDLVLDPFLGSGTALEAGYFINRNVLGFELDPQWEKLYEKRAHTYQKGLDDWI